MQFGFMLRCRQILRKKNENCVFAFVDLLKTFD